MVFGRCAGAGTGLVFVEVSAALGWGRNDKTSIFFLDYLDHLVSIT